MEELQELRNHIEAMRCHLQQVVAARGNFTDAEVRQISNTLDTMIVAYETKKKSLTVKGG